MSTTPISVEEARQHGIPLPTLLKASINAVAKKKKSTTQRTRAKRPAQPEKYTVAQAFDYFYGPHSSDEHDTLNDERALRAVAFLLTYCSQQGNQLLDGNAANGLARVVEFCAARR